MNQILANCDALLFLERMDSETATLVYFDPPSHPSKASGKDDLQALYLHSACHAKRLLNDRGVLVWHVLPERDLGIRTCLDMVFGADFFVSEKILIHESNSCPSKAPTTNHTSLVIYGKTRHFTYKEPTRPALNDFYLYSEDEGGSFQIKDMTIRVNRTEMSFPWKGFTPPPGRTWRYNAGTLNEMLAQNRILMSGSALPMEKVYGIKQPVEDIGSVWSDIDLRPKECVENNTSDQQSLVLLSRIIDMVTEKDDLIIDPFCGSGTSLLAAHQLQRKWIGNDLSKAACDVTMGRLTEAGVQFNFLCPEEVQQLPVLSSLTELLRSLPTVSELRHADVHKLIVEGESKTVEFKESLSLDVRTNKKEKFVEISCIKTIAGFLNSDGGTLLIGVTDAGKVIGVDNEINLFYKNSDKFCLHLKDLIRDYISEEFYCFVDYNLVKADGRTILRVDCNKSEAPCFIGDDFYVRVNPATDKLVGPSMLRYIHSRFPNYA